MQHIRKPRSPAPVKMRASELRHALTPAEQLLWQCLRNRRLGVKFRRQVPIGPFIVDFFCHEARLVVEIDGEAHAEKDQAALDAARSAWLAENGYRVLRFWNRAVMDEMENVLAQIERKLPLPRSAGEGLG